MTPNDGAGNGQAQTAAAKLAASDPFRKAVDTLLLDFAAQAGLVSAEEPKIGLSLLEERIYEEIRSKRVSSIQPPDDHDNRHDPATSSSKAELTTVIFTAGPTLRQAEQDLLYREVFNRCQHAIWNLTQTAERGAVQRLLHDDGLLLVRGPVWRDGQEVKDGLYVTTRPELIISDFLGPHFEKLGNLAEALADDYQLLEERLPAETMARVKRELEKKLETIWTDLQKIGAVEGGSGST